MTLPTREQRLERALSRLLRATLPFARIAWKYRDQAIQASHLANPEDQISGSDFANLAGARAEALLLLEEER